ncbi:MAG: hypothetical protein LBT04_04385 [Prevotellaceae bacterium]|nr:hypothetical protein [Prevotellaceae bacterium]
MILAIFIAVRYFHVFSEGVKTGNLNYLVYRGYVFKTHEGNLIQSDFRKGVVGAVQSYEFQFSVVDDSIARQLMLNSSKDMQLHYKEYFAPIFWRGKSRYVVNKIESISSE